MSDTLKTEAKGGIPDSEALKLAELVAVGDGAVVSRTLAKGKSGTLTLFAFDAGQELSEHSAPFDAYVQVLMGEVAITIDGNPVEASEGDVVLMPANIPHGLKALTPFKMLLVMFKG